MKTAGLDLDALVLGGGPAGSACAIVLARAGARVAIAEAGDFSQFRIGETIEVSAKQILARLGIGFDEKEWAVACSGVAAAWGGPDLRRRPAILDPLGAGWRVDRRRFDYALFAHAMEVGTIGLMQHRLTSAERAGTRWSFELAGSHGYTRGHTAWIVAATGRSARAPLAPSSSRRWLDRLVGIAVMEDAPASTTSNASSSAVVAAAPSGWWYSAVVPDGRRLAVLFTDADLLRDGLADFVHEQLQQCPSTQMANDFIAKQIERRQWCGFDARSSIRHVVMSDGWLALGDAAMAFDPLCGRGVVEALSSGIEGAEWLSSCCPLEADGLPAWVKRAASRFNEYCIERLSVYAEELRWPDSRFWQRRQARSVRFGDTGLVGA